MGIRNQYSNQLPYFDAIPKAVLAAIAVSFASSGGDELDHAAQNVAREWVTLHENGIVRQKPPADIRRLAAEADARDNADLERYAAWKERATDGAK